MSYSATETDRAPQNQSIARSAIWNLTGQIVPLVVAVSSIPLLIRGLGADRFGVLSLAWVVIGYFGLVDLGLGRAMTQALASRIGSGQGREIPAIFWSTFALMGVLGLVGSICGLALTPWLVNQALSIPDALQPESETAFMILAAALPLDMTLSALRGAMEARQRFDLTSMSRIATGAHTYLSPIGVLFFTDSLVVVVAVLVIGRFLAWLVAFWLCMRVFPSLRARPVFRRSTVAPLLRSGGWMNVCGLVFPLMVTLDRFLIGSLVSVTAVTYYATPYEMITKLWVFPVAVAGVLFPAFSARYATDPAGTARLFSSGVRAVFLVVVPAVLGIVVVAPDLLGFWLGPDFTGSSARVLQILAIGVCVNSLSNIPFALVQGAGRSDWAAKLQLCELPIYVVAVWAMAHVAGIQGVATVWAVRGVIDTLALFWMAGRLTRPVETIVPIAALVANVVLLSGAVALFPATLAGKVLYGVVAVSVSLAIGWRSVLGDSERRYVLATVRTRMPLRMKNLVPETATELGGVPR